MVFVQLKGEILKFNIFTILCQASDRLQLACYYSVCEVRLQNITSAPPPVRHPHLMSQLFQFLDISQYIVMSKIANAV